MRTTPFPCGLRITWLAIIVSQAFTAACVSEEDEALTAQTESELSTVTWVQTKSGGSGATSATFDLPQTAGDLNIVIVGWRDNTQTITGVTDTRGNTYAVAAPMATGTGTVAPLRQAIYYAKNIAGGTNTVSVAFRGAPSYPNVRILEYRGLDPSAPLDVTEAASGTGASTTVSSGRAPTHAPNELVVGAGMTTARFAHVGNSFRQRTLSSDGNLTEDKLTGFAGSFSATAVLNATTQSWLLQMVTFKGVGGTCTPTTCAAQGDNCGTLSNGCGGTLSCGSCTAPATCGGGGTPNVCGAPSGSYSTNFPGTEDPISQGGRWLNGGAAGRNLWGNVQMTPGLAFGVSEPTGYGDPTAILTGTWSTDQSAHATLKVVNSVVVTGQCCHEAEIRLRTTINPTNNTITGYEAYCSVMSSVAYCHIASWGGPNGVWANMGSRYGIYLRDRDVLKATVTGTYPVTITLYVGQTQVLQVHDTGNYTFQDGRQHGPWTTGNPGLGFYDDRGDSAWSYFGFSNFSATGL